MHRKSYLCLLGAIALLSMTACQHEVIGEEGEETKAEEVNTKFVFSIDTGNTAPYTKQTAADTQADITQEFRGLSSAYLAAYKLVDAQDHLTDGRKVTDPTLTAEKWFPLGEIVGAGSIDPDATGGTVPKSRRVINLSLPSGTNAMLFYGQAKKDKSDDYQGKVTIIGGNDLTATTIKMQSRLPSTTDADYKFFTESYDLMALVLNYIINFGVNGLPGDDLHKDNMSISYAYGGQTLTFDSALNWKDYATMNGLSPVAAVIEELEDQPSSTALENILSNAYIQLTTLRQVTLNPGTEQETVTTEIRAGSGAALARTIGDLYQVLDKISTQEVTSIQDQVAKEFARRINARIHEFLSGSGTSCQWNSVNAITSILQGYYKTQTYGTDQTYARFKELSELSSTNPKSDLNRFPTNFGIPNGAAVLKYDANPSDGVSNFYYNFDHIDLSGMGITGNPVGADHYLFPAELCYFGNSSIMVSKTEFTPGQYPDGAEEWEAYNWGSAWQNGHVTSTTSSVAIKDNINYGTALLQTTVQYDTGTLKDNNSGIHPGETDNNISVTTAGAFELTGIIIGGQTNELGWDFLPKSTSEFNYLIYDGVVSNSAIPAYTTTTTTTKESVPIYTMVMDNYNPALDINQQSPVYVALEFRNQTGVDFWGMHNMVRNGGTFYIIGKLDPNAAGAITLPSNYDLPPYTSATDATSKMAKRVFIQSFKTEAHFFLTENSLKYAYVTVPDLRSTELSLGLSVDVSWHSGVNFSRIELGAM